jgi:hypothetical protein
MSRDRNRRDRKRKKRQAREKRNPRPAESPAYTGGKYKTDELIPAWMHAEIGIYQTYVMTDERLVDQTVASGLERLIRMMRAGKLPPLSQTDEIHYEVGREEDLLIENIRRSWAEHFATEWRPPGDKLIGVLRTILGSVETMKAPGPRSQSYLKHIAGFLTKKLGVSVKGYSADRKPLPEPLEDELVLLGRDWTLHGDPEARAEFFELAADLMKSGQAGRVIDACHLLAGEVSDPASEATAELFELSGKARRALIAATG